MKKNILIFNTKNNLSEFSFDIINSLSEVADYVCIGKKKEKVAIKCKQAKSLKINLNLSTSSSLGSFLKNRLILPFYKIKFIFILIFYRLKYKPTSAILFSIEEKILLTRFLKLLKINPVWIEENFFKYNKSSWIKKTVRKISKNINILSFNSSYSQNLVDTGIPFEEINQIIPWLPQRAFQYQEDLFHNIAHKEASQIGKKYFTIGIITNLDDQNKIEIVLHAAKKLITVIPKLQILIVGDGIYAPNNNPWSKWVTKKMEIENFVWFVSERNNKKKWLDSLDIYISSILKMNSLDLKNTMLAQSSALPVVVSGDIGFEDIVKHGETGLMFEQGKSEDLAEKIIKLYKDKHFHTNISKKASQFALDSYRENGRLDLIKKLFYIA